MTPKNITREVLLDVILETNSKLADLAVGVGRLDERLVAIERATEERFSQQDKVISDKFSEIKEEIALIQGHEEKCRIGAVDADVKALKEYQEHNPSLVWLFRNRTKAALSWTAFAVSVFILTVAPFADRRILGALLKFIGVPDPIVELIIME